MARPCRPSSESYQSVLYSSEAGIVGAEEDNEDEAPIFSLSKSSMDVVMATGPPHKRDPAWTRLDLRRSSSTNTPSKQNSVLHQPLHPNMRQQVSSPNNQLLLTKQNLDLHSPPALNERWISDVQRWSGCSASTHSRSSTPDTVVWRGATSRPRSLTQETPFCVVPDSPGCKETSSPTTPSPFISPLQSPTLPLVDVFSSHSPSPVPQRTHQQENLPCSSPLRSSPLLSKFPNHLCMEDNSFPASQPMSFTFPDPIPSSSTIEEVGLASNSRGLGTLTESPERDGQLTERSPKHLIPNPTLQGQGLSTGASVCCLELPRVSFPTARSWKTPLASSLSDSHLRDSCRCNFSRDGTTTVSHRAENAEVIRQEGAMTSRVHLVDAEVQTISPVCSWWNLKRNTSNSNLGSQSILGSPPGSRLNLRYSVGSHSNLVSPSSSMFPVSSGEDEDRLRDDLVWDEDYHDLYRGQSCLKRHQRGSRSSMKQVQWDENEMTWEVHRAAVEPEVLVSAMKKRLDLKITEEPKTPRPLRHSTKEKQAPKPPLLSEAANLTPPIMTVTSTCVMEGESEVKTDAGKVRELEDGGKKEGAAETVRIISKTQGDIAKEDVKEKEENEVSGNERRSRSKSPSHGSRRNRKKSLIRSFRRPGWCGGSGKTDD